MATKKFVPAVLNLFTLVGGHFYNRRPDRSLFFIALIVFWYFISTVLTSVFSHYMPVVKVGNNSISNFQLTTNVQLAGVVIIFILSAITGYRNEQLPTTGDKKQRIVNGFSAAILSILGILLVSYQLFTTYMTNTFFGKRSMLTLEYPPDKISNQNIPSMYNGETTDRLFLNGTPFKRYDNSFHDPDLPDPPPGRAALAGEFHLDGKAIPGITFDMVLNGKYRAKNITTNSKGRFSIPIQPGTWHIHYVQLSAWQNKPAGQEFMLLNGREEKLSDTFYDSHGFNQHNGGLPVIVPADTSLQAVVTFNIARKLELIEPKSDASKQELDAERDVVRWQAYPGTKTYLVRFNKITRQGSRTTYTPVVKRRVVDATQLPLSSLTTVTQPGEKLEYEIKVFAFDENNNFLSDSEITFENPTIVLAGNKALVDDAMTELLAQPSAKDLNEMYKNENRLDAVKILIQEKLYKEAEALLKKVQGKTKPGAKEAMTGYLLAEQNQCAEAEKYFEKAKQASTNACVPDCYRKNCVK